MSLYEQNVSELQRNTEQWAAFESKSHCVVLAGPGSGKTKLLTTKLARVLREDVREPRGVACVTFNNECVHELERRLDKLGVGDRRNVFIGTLHRFCMRYVLSPLARIVGIEIPHPLAVAPEKLQKRLLGEAMESVGVRAPGLEVDLGRFRRTAIDREVGVDGWEPGDRGLTDVCIEYERLLRAHGRVDFDDIILIAVRAIERSESARRCLRARFAALFVDEYQDLGVPLHRMVLSMCFTAGVRLFAVGDPDQSIYGFTGGRPDLLRALSDDARVQRVEVRTNYRSAKRIVQASEVAIGGKRGYSAHSGAEGSVSFKHCPRGLQEQVDWTVEQLIPGLIASGEPYGEIAVLYPTWQEGKALEEGMRAAALPYVRLDGGSGYRRTPLLRLVEDLAAWCCGGWRRADPPLTRSLIKWQVLVEVPSTHARAVQGTLVRFLFSKRDASGSAAAWLRDLDAQVMQMLRERGMLAEDDAEAFQELLVATAPGGPLAALDIGLFAGKSGSSKHVALMNLHTAKGTEFNAVILVGMDNGRIPLYLAKTPEALAEQRRLFFVGVSRARRQVHLQYSGWTASPSGYRFNNGPSPYLLELKAALGEA